jgi:hypothetical protein
VSEQPKPVGLDTPLDLGAYCRGVEEHLARVNEGHIIRIVGTSFDLVRSWAIEGIPLGVVFRGIEQKAGRHRTGRSKRPLRLEFCEGDVRALYDEWRRAVGVWSSEPQSGEPGVDLPPAIEERRRPSPTRQLDRAIDRVVAAAGRLDLDGSVRASLSSILDQLVLVRDALRHARGATRQELINRTGEIDRTIATVAREAAGPLLADVEREAATELAPFRGRLPVAAWHRSFDAGVDRLLRERYGLPVLDVAAPAGGMESQD